MSNASRSSSDRGSRVRSRLEHLQHQRRVAQRDRAERERDRRRAPDRGRNARVEQRDERLVAAGDRPARRAPARTPRSRSWNPMFAIANVSVSISNFWCDAQLMPSRQIAAATVGCDVCGAVRCSARQRRRALACRRSCPARASRRPAADHRAWRPSMQRRKRVRRLVVAERLDHGAAEEVLPLHHQRRQRLLRGADRRRRRRARASAPGGRTRTSSFVERVEQARRHAALRVVLEVGVGDGAQPVVRLVERGDA